MKSKARRQCRAQKHRQYIRGQDLGAKRNDRNGPQHVTTRLPLLCVGTPQKTGFDSPHRVVFVVLVSGPAQATDYLSK